MTFIPEFQSIFESQVPDNILAIAKRDMKAALDYFYPPATGAAALDASVARPVGTTTLHMDGLTSKPQIGERFTIAGDPQIYTVNEASALVGTDTDITFRPGLKVAIPAVDGNQAVTFTGLPDFAQRTLGDFMRLSLPVLIVDPKRVTGEDGEHFTSPQLKVDLYIGVEDADPTEATRLLTKYIRAFGAVLKTASLADYLVNVTPNKVFGLIKELTWEYGQLSKDADNGTWLRPASFEFTLKYNEG